MYQGVHEMNIQRFKKYFQKIEKEFNISLDIDECIEFFISSPNLEKYTKVITPHLRVINMAIHRFKKLKGSKHTKEPKIDKNISKGFVFGLVSKSWFKKLLFEK